MSSGSKSRTSRFKAFIRGGSSLPSTSSAPNSPPTNYKNLKYVKDSITKSTSNMSISSLHHSSSNKMHASTTTTTTTTTTTNEIELNTKRRFESLKSYTIDSFNNRNSNATTNSSISSREGSVLSDKFTSSSSGFQTNLPGINVKIPYQEGSLSSTRSECPSPNLSIASSSKLVNGPFAQTFPQKKRNTVYEVSSECLFFSFKTNDFFSFLNPTKLNPPKIYLLLKYFNPVILKTSNC